MGGPMGSRCTRHRRARSRSRWPTATPGVVAARLSSLGSGEWVGVEAEPDLPYDSAVAECPDGPVAERFRVAPAVGFEPTTKRLTAARSTTELRRSEGAE